MQKVFMFIATALVLHFVTLNPAISGTVNGEKFNVSESYAGREYSGPGETHHAGSPEADNEVHHTGDMSPLFFIILALFIGTGTRHFLRKSPLPFTITLFVIGLVLGIANRMGLFGALTLGSMELNLGFLGQAVNWAGNIDPHIILFVFLPTLLFEAAFALDIHTFKKSVGNAFLMAVPGIIIALILTGATVMGIKAIGLGLEYWTWPVALMFGVIVSATDPVAVVSILKELGASKKLATLIESESLLNDGTAIVIFMVLLMTITGTASETPVIIEFLRVAVGGTFIGVLIGMLVIKWVKRVFNDALFEITVIISAAYLSFFVAEHFFHVSGVLAVVAFGLIMASAGRTRISPEVGHFLHEFWELAAFIANTLIFIIVGVVIAQKVVFAPVDFLILAIIYISMLIIRALVIVVFYPLMKKIGYGLNAKDAAIVWWGGLRGAIGLALALIVAAEMSIIPEIRNEILSLTAGIVVLFSLINATTIKALVDYLGLTKVASAKLAMMANSMRYLHSSTENAIEKLKEDRFMSGANWNAVKEYLPEKPAGPEGEDENGKLHLDTISETRKRILQKEKASYWRQFSEGLLGPSAVQRLSDDIDVLLDAGGTISLSLRKDLEQFWKTPKYMNWIQSVPVIGRLAKQLFFEKLAVSYDSARGFVAAQEEVQKLVGSLVISVNSEGGNESKEAENLEIIEDEINENRIQGLTFLRNLKEAFPEIYNAIETRQAIRSTLNHQRNTVKRLLKSGRIEPDEAGRILSDIEGRMKLLIDSPPQYKEPEVMKLLNEAEWLKGLDPKTFTKVLDSFTTRIYSVGEKLFREDKPGDGFFIILRGNVKVEMGSEVVDVIGPGTVIGEMANLMNLPRTATVTAEQPVTALRMTAAKMIKLIRESDEMERRLWKIAGARYVENYLGKLEPYSKWTRKKLRKWISAGEMTFLNDSESIDLNEKIALLLSGQVYVTSRHKPIQAPALLYAPLVYVYGEAKIFHCAKVEEGVSTEKPSGQQ
jgi:NhaP-type Na+/H+ or K+/H+ antiporter/CRP-like cAMP-binding protein